jgi:hypothetical protein
MTFNHSTQIATQSTPDTDMKLVVPELGGEFTHQAHGREQFVRLAHARLRLGRRALSHVRSDEQARGYLEVLGAGCQYPEAGTEAPGRSPVLLTDRINQYLTDHPEIFEHYRARAWENTIREHRYQIRQKQALSGARSGVHRAGPACSRRASSSVDREAGGVREAAR